MSWGRRDASPSELIRKVLFLEEKVTFGNQSGQTSDNWRRWGLKDGDNLVARSRDREGE